ncbi:unnamed protein product [Mytilus coruscus]|uniref:Uncharacterized protein n=1 Tax=Mytilus coruscus TaxID=42192 RepID=A0A6J8BKD2_MYTCO|nr:unnamed protein product [Mytilus coruscus]
MSEDEIRLADVVCAIIMTPENIKGDTWCQQNETSRNRSVKEFEPKDNVVIQPITKQIQSNVISCAPQNTTEPTKFYPSSGVMDLTSMKHLDIGIINSAGDTSRHAVSVRSSVEKEMGKDFSFKSLFLHPSKVPIEQSKATLQQITALLDEQMPDFAELPNELQGHLHR